MDKEEINAQIKKTAQDQRPGLVQIKQRPIRARPRVLIGTTGAYGPGAVFFDTNKRFVF